MSTTEDGDEYDEEESKSSKLLLDGHDNDEWFQSDRKRARSKTWCARNSSVSNLLASVNTSQADTTNDIPMQHQRPRFLSWGVRLTTLDADNEVDKPPTSRINLEDGLLHDSDDVSEITSEMPFSLFYDSFTRYWRGSAGDNESLSSFKDEERQLPSSPRGSFSDFAIVSQQCPKILGHGVPLAPMERWNDRPLRASPVPSDRVKVNNCPCVPENDISSCVESNPCRAPSLPAHYRESILSTRVSKLRDQNCVTYLFSVFVGCVVMVVFAIYVLVALFHS